MTTDPVAEYMRSQGEEIHRLRRETDALHRLASAQRRLISAYRGRFLRRVRDDAAAEVSQAEADLQEVREQLVRELNRQEAP